MIKFIVLVGQDIPGSDETFSGEYTGVLYDSSGDAMEELKLAKSEYPFAWISLKGVDDDIR